ncbi:MAG: alpha/beta fold hydrolase, partial [Myxococcales bacterium]
MLTHARTWHLDVPGARLRVLEAGEGPPLLLLASPLLLARSYHPVVRALRRDYRVLVAELPGSGGSSRRTRWDPVERADVVAHLLDALALRQPLVIAHSLSGPVAIALALRAPERLGGLVLSDVIGAPHH